MAAQMSVELERALRKSKAVLSARFALKRAFDRIDYDLDVVRPAVSAIKNDAAVGELPEFVLDA